MCMQHPHVYLGLDIPSNLSCDLLFTSCWHEDITLRCEEVLFCCLCTWESHYGAVCLCDVCVRVWVGVHVWVYMCVWVCMWVGGCACVSVCVYVRACVCV